MQKSDSSWHELIESEALPAGFVTTVEGFYKPLANSIARQSAEKTGPLVVGINGAQGTGKSTLALFLETLLESEHQLSTARFSIDDLYLPKSERQKMAREIHPLLATRGVPGTHDLSLGTALFEDLRSASEESTTAIPVFDKSIDDRLPDSRFYEFRGKPDVILFEGWCVGSVCQCATDLVDPLNELERIEDANGIWRDYVNRQLATVYQDLFSVIDLLVFIRAPDWPCIYQWRLLQEQKLKQRLEHEHRDTSQLLSEAQVARFIQHYERITRHNLVSLPDRADYLLDMQADHTLVSLTEKPHS